MYMPTYFLPSLVAPKIVPFDFGVVPANFEDSVSVNCLISTGDMPLDIEWLFNGEPVNYFAGVNVMKGGKRTSLLTIDSVHAGHAGNYTCKARNKAAMDAYSALLIVNGYYVIIYYYLVYILYIVKMFEVVTKKYVVFVFS